MALVSISEAAKIAKVSRSHLYKRYINTGKLKVLKDRWNKPWVDTLELTSIFRDTDVAKAGPGAENGVSPKERPLEDEVIWLRAQFQEYQERERESRIRESWLHDQMARLIEIIGHLLKID